ncbi:MAG: hypothetical protein HFF11_05330 [Angelakisella sp.]|nr:hypothetical protein [Angelakisella sp.]
MSRTPGLSGGSALSAFALTAHSGGHRSAHPPHRRHGDHQWDAASKGIPGPGGIQPNAADQIIYLSGHPGDGYHKEQPGQDSGPAGDGRHGGQQQLQKNHIHQHHHAHGAVHPDPALENVLGAFAAAHPEGQRRHNGKGGEDHIPLGDLKEKADDLKDKDKADDDHHQPSAVPKTKVTACGNVDGDTVRHSQKVHHPAGEGQADATDLAIDHQ